MNKIKVVILAGGLGTRLSEETQLRPKPMVEIGGRPILWHIMKIYSHYGFNDFIVCLGYKGYMIKEYFLNYSFHESDLSVDLKTNSRKVINYVSEPWNVTLIDTGLETATGGRIKRIQKYIGNETFMATYGDGLSNVNIRNLLDYHKQLGKMITVTAVQPPGRFGAIEINEDGTIERFMEKPKGDGAWINGGFFVLQPEVFNYIDSDDTVFEKYPLQTLSKKNQMAAFKHLGFWKGMDTLRDKFDLERLFNSGEVPWMSWND